MEKETNRTDTLTAGMDNVLAVRLARAMRTAAAMPAGDGIDVGLALRKCLEDEGFGLVQLDSNSRLFGGQHQR